MTEVGEKNSMKLRRDALPGLTCRPRVFADLQNLPHLVRIWSWVHYGCIPLGAPDPVALRAIPATGLGAGPTRYNLFPKLKSIKNLRDTHGFHMMFFCCFHVLYDLIWFLFDFRWFSCDSIWFHIAFI